MVFLSNTQILEYSFLCILDNILSSYSSFFATFMKSLTSFNQLKFATSYKDIFLNTLLKNLSFLYTTRFVMLLTKFFACFFIKKTLTKPKAYIKYLKKYLLSELQF